MGDHPPQIPETVTQFFAEYPNARVTGSGCLGQSASSGDSQAAFFLGASDYTTSSDGSEGNVEPYRSWLFVLDGDTFEEVPLPVESGSQASIWYWWPIGYLDGSLHSIVRDEDSASVVRFDGEEWLSVPGDYSPLEQGFAQLSGDRLFVGTWGNSSAGFAPIETLLSTTDFTEWQPVTGLPELFTLDPKPTDFGWILGWGDREGDRPVGPLVISGDGIHAESLDLPEIETVNGASQLLYAEGVFIAIGRQIYVGKVTNS